MKRKLLAATLFVTAMGSLAIAQNLQNNNNSNGAVNPNIGNINISIRPFCRRPIPIRLSTILTW